MDKFLTKSALFILILISHSALSKPRYSYAISYIKLDTINNIVYLKAEITVKNQSLFLTQYIPYPILVPHLTSAAKDTFAYTSNNIKYGGNISFYILDSLDNKYYFHESHNECGAIRMTEQSNRFVKLKSGSIATIEVIGILQINKLSNKSNCITAGGFRTKVSLKNQSESKFIDLVINQSLIFCEFKTKNKIYNSIKGSVLH